MEKAKCLSCSVLSHVEPLRFPRGRGGSGDRLRTHGRFCQNVRDMIGYCQVPAHGHQLVSQVFTYVLISYAFYVQGQGNGVEKKTSSSS